MWLCILPGSFFKSSSLLPRLLKVACTLAFLKSLVLKNEQRSAHRWCFLALLLPSADPSLSTCDPVELGDAVGGMWCRGVPCSARQGSTRRVRSPGWFMGQTPQMSSAVCHRAERPEPLRVKSCMKRKIPSSRVLFSNTNDLLLKDVVTMCLNFLNVAHGFFLPPFFFFSALLS